MVEEGDEPQLIENIKYVSGRSKIYQRDFHPGAGAEPTMGFNVKTHTLNYTTFDSSYSITLFGHTSTITSTYSSAIYTRINNDTTLATVESEMDVDIPDLPRYELKNLGPYLTYSTMGKINPYKYYLIDFDNLTEKANIYYEYVDDNTPHVERDLAVTVARLGDNLTGYHNAMSLTIKDSTYYIQIDGDYIAPTSMFLVHE